MKRVFKCAREDDERSSGSVKRSRLGMQVHVNRLISGAVVTFLYLLESYWFDNLGIFTEGNLLLHYISPSTWRNQRGVRELSSPYQPQCQFLFSAVFLFQFSPILKVLKKFKKNQ